MNTHPVSFGKKTPIVKCNIVNRKTEETSPATICMYDCEDRSDEREIRNLPKYFYYKDEFADNIKKEYLKKIIEPEKKQKNYFFCLQDDKQNILGIAQTHFMKAPTQGNMLIVDLLQSNPKSKYKYVGQSLLSGLCARIKDGIASKMLVLYPADTAVNFYKNKCGFSSAYGDTLILPQEDFNQFIETTERKVGGRFENI